MAINTGKVKFFFQSGPPASDNRPNERGSIWVDHNNAVIYVAVVGQSGLVWRASQVHGDQATQIINPHKLLIYINQNGLFTLPPLALSQVELRELFPKPFVVNDRALSRTNFAQLHTPYVSTLIDIPVPKVDIPLDQLFYSNPFGRLKLVVNKPNRDIILDCYFVHVFSNGLEIESHKGFVLNSGDNGQITFDYDLIKNDYLLTMLIPPAILERVRNEPDFFVSGIKFINSIRGLKAPATNVRYNAIESRPLIDSNATPEEQLLQGYSTFKVVKTTTTSDGGGFVAVDTDLTDSDYSTADDLILTGATHSLNAVMHIDQAVLSQKGDEGTPGINGKDGATNLLIFKSGDSEPELPTTVAYNAATNKLTANNGWLESPPNSNQNIYQSLGKYNPRTDSELTNLASKFSPPAKITRAGPAATQVLASLKDSYFFNFIYRWDDGNDEHPHYELTDLLGVYTTGQVKTMEVVPRQLMARAVQPGMRIRHDVHGYVQFSLAGNQTSGSGLVQLTLTIKTTRADGTEIGIFSRVSDVNFRKGDPATHTLNARFGFDDERFDIGTPLPKTDGTMYILQESDFKNPVYIEYILTAKVLTDAGADTTGDIKELFFDFGQINLYQLNPTYEIVNAKADATAEINAAKSELEAQIGTLETDIATNSTAIAGLQGQGAIEYYESTPNAETLKVNTIAVVQDKLERVVEGQPDNIFRFRMGVNRGQNVIEQGYSVVRNDFEPSFGDATHVPGTAVKKIIVQVDDPPDPQSPNASYEIEIEKAFFINKNQTISNDSTADLDPGVDQIVYSWRKLGDTAFTNVICSLP